MMTNWKIDETHWNLWEKQTRRLWKLYKFFTVFSQIEQKYFKKTNSKLEFEMILKIVSK